jgi:hypothetical protein
MFPGNDLHWRFYYADRQWKSIFTGGPQLPACKNDDFYWPLALAVTKNATINRFTTVIIELLCTSDMYTRRSSLVKYIWTYVSQRAAGFDKLFSTGYFPDKPIASKRDDCRLPAPDRSISSREHDSLENEDAR